MKGQKNSAMKALQNKVEGLTNIVKNLIKEIQINANVAQGTLAAFQHHLGKEEWEKIIEELKDIEKRHLESQEETIGPKLEIPKEK